MSAGSQSSSVAVAADGQAIAGKASLEGWSVAETAAAAATVIIRNGTSTSGTAVAYINLAASASQTINLDGINCPNGIFVDVVTGAVSVIIYYKN